jgi:3-isopropylmalate dehydrogenase
LLLIYKEAAAKDIENALIKALESGKIKSMSAGKMGLSTTQVGDLIASYI